MKYSGWRLSESDRERLLSLFTPAYPDIVAHHITLQHGGEVTMPPPATFRVIGTVDDNAGVQALVIHVTTPEHSSHKRPDGLIYHVTWSIDRSAGRRSAHSNQVLVAQPYFEVENTVDFEAFPAIMESNSRTERHPVPDAP